jgi:PAS domain S-box-containing protein
MTSRTHAGDAVLDAERFYALVPDLMCVVGFDGYLHSVNPAWEPTVGWTEEELLSRPYTEFIVPDDRERTLMEVAKLADPSETTRDFTIQLLHRDGGTRAISWSAQGDVAKGVLYAVGKDLTQRELLEEMRRRSEERYRGLAESVSDAVISADADGVITHWNAGAERMFGQAAGAAIGQPLEIIMPERYRAPHGEGIARLRAGGAPKLLGGTVDLEALRADGTEFPVELSLGSHTVSGEVVYTGVVRDATERRRVERFQAAQLSTSEAFRHEGSELEILTQVHAGIAEAMGWKVGGLWREDPDDSRLRCAALWRAPDIEAPKFAAATRDAAFARGEGLPGVAWERGTGVRVHDVSTQANFPRLEAAAADGLHGGVAVPVCAGDECFAVMDFFNHAADWVDQGMVEAMYVLAGLAGQYIARRRAREDLRSANLQLSARAAELERSNAELEQFAYVASHDLAEPLRSIAGFTQLLERRYADTLDQEGADFMKFIVEGVSRMQALIDDLLVYSRVGRGEQPTGPVDIGDVVEQALHGLAVQIEEAGAKVTVGELPVVEGNQRELGQLFGNLLSNAIKFRGDRAPEVEVSAGACDGGWRFTVSDNGIGIEDRHAERIFKMFQRLHARDEYAGTGIGLALCRKVVEGHGGRIGVESAPGEGSTFTFTILEAATR